MMILEDVFAYISLETGLIQVCTKLGSWIAIGTEWPCRIFSRISPVAPSSCLKTHIFCLVCHALLVSFLSLIFTKLCTKIYITMFAWIILKANFEIFPLLGHIFPKVAKTWPFWVPPCTHVSVHFWAIWFILSGGGHAKWVLFLSDFLWVVQLTLEVDQ